MSKIELVKSIKEMTLYELDDFTWKKYEHSNKSVEVILKRPDSDYEIHQMQNDDVQGWTEVMLDNVLIKINWQACNASIYICGDVTKKVLDFIRNEIADVSPEYLIDSYYWVLDWPVEPYGISMSDFLVKIRKTTEQRQASEHRKQLYLAQEDKAIQMLINADSLYEYIDGLKYVLSLSMRYSKNFKNFVLECGQQEDRLDKCLKAGILKPWNDTYYFDKDKADSLQQYLKEKSFVNPFKTEIPN